MGSEDRRRPSLWDRQRDAWYRDAARSRVQGTAGSAAFLVCVIAVLLALVNAGRLDTWAGAGLFALAFPMAALGVGLLTGRRWAARLGGTLLGILAVCGVFLVPVALWRGYEMELFDVVMSGVVLVGWWSTSRELSELARGSAVPPRTTDDPGPEGS